MFSIEPLNATYVCLAELISLQTNPSSDSNLQLVAVAPRIPTMPIVHLGCKTKTGLRKVPLREL